MENISLICETISKVIASLPLPKEFRQGLANFTLYKLLKSQGLHLPASMINLNVFEMPPPGTPASNDAENPYIVATIHPCFKRFANAETMRRLGGRDYTGKTVIRTNMDLHFTTFSPTYDIGCF